LFINHVNKSLFGGLQLTCDERSKSCTIGYSSWRNNVSNVCHSTKQTKFSTV